MIELLTELLTGLFCVVVFEVIIMFGKGIYDDFFSKPVEIDYVKVSKRDWERLEKMTKEFQE